MVFRAQRRRTWVSAARTLELVFAMLSPQCVSHPELHRGRYRL